MKRKTQWVVWLGLVVMSWPGSAQTDTQVLRIYMPRTIRIKGVVPTLGQVAIVRGNDALVRKSQSVSMGRIAASGGQVVIDRNTILSRLASHGITGASVTLSGAEKIVVQQQSKTVTSGALVQCAQAALKNFPMNPSVSQVALMRTPAHVVMRDEDQALSLKVDAIEQLSANQIRVRVDVLQDGQKLAFRDVVFGLKYRLYRLVTNVDIMSGLAIDHRLVRVVEGLSDRPTRPDENALWYKNAEGKMVVREGLTAMRNLPAGTVIRSGMLGLPPKEILVKRRQSVVIRLENFGLMVSAMGVAQEDGSVGDMIKVRNADSRRLIIARVNADGSVAPVL